MPLLTENSFEALSDPVVEHAENFTLKVLKRLKSLATRFINDPSTNLNIQAEMNRIDGMHDGFMDDVEEWIIASIPSAYIRGIEDVNGTLRELGIEMVEQPTQFGPQGVFTGGSGGGGDIPDVVRRRFGGYGNHLTMYDVFAGSARRDFMRSHMPVTRDVQDKIREIVLQASDERYVSGDDFTRRQLSQDLMNRFAKDNITGIQYSDGRTMKLDTYSEMVARTQTGNAARQAQLNRLKELDHDLVRMSIHWPCSNLCIDWQGGVYSQDGTHTHYTSLREAIQGGAFHANCKHSLSGYFPGTSPAHAEADKLTREENRKQYEAQNKQRYNERQIRFWKRREATALTDRERQKAKAKIKSWQGRNRRLVNQHDFLRRKYQRESI